MATTTTAAARPGRLRKGAGSNGRLSSDIPLVTLEYLAEIILAHYESRGSSNHTWLIVRRTLDVLKQVGVDTNAQLNDLAIRRFDAFLSEVSTVRRFHLLAMCRAVCNHAVKLKLLDSCPEFPTIPHASQIPAKNPKILRPAPTLKDVKALWDYLQLRACTWEGHRLFALFAVVVLAGLRREEALRLETKDVDLMGETIWIAKRHNRGANAYTALPPQVRIPADLKTILASWLRQVPGCQWVFPGKRLVGPWRADSHLYDPLTAIHDAARAVGIKAEVTFESLRLFHLRNSVTTVDLGGTKARPKIAKPAPKAAKVRARSVPSVKINGLAQAVLVRDVPKKLTPSEYRVIMILLLKYREGGLSLKGMNLLYGKKSWRQILITLRKDPDWAAAIGVPGPRKSGGSDLYRILPK